MNRSILYFLLGFQFFCVANLPSQERDSLFTNSLFYNSLYDNGDFIDSAYVANLVQIAESSSGQSKIEALHKLLNGYYFSNPELTRDLALESLDVCHSLNNDSLLAFSLHYLGLAYIYLDQHRLSIDTYKKALQTPWAWQHQDFHSWASLNLANSYLSLGEFDEAAKYFYQAAALNDFIQNKAFEAKVHENLGSLFLKTGQFVESDKEYQAALALLDSEKDKRVISDIYSNLAVLEIRHGNQILSQEYFDMALGNARALNDSSKITEVFFAYGDALFNHEFYQKALNYFQKGLLYCNSQNYAIDYHTFLLGMGKSLLYLGQTAKAEDYLLQAKSGLENDKATAELYDLESSLSKLYARTGNWDKFNDHLKRSEYYKAAELEAKELSTIHELKVLHETEKKDRLLKAQKLRIANQQKQVFLMVVIALILLAGLIIALIFRHKLKIANQVLYQKNLDITQRWNQLQQFYTIREDSLEKTNDLSIFTKITTAMSEEKLYTNPELTIDLLARKVSSNTKYVSHAINENTQMNFSTYVNTFRIEEAKHLLKEQESQHWSMEAIAEQCGFNNPTSFYQAFKKNTGMTPATFKNTTVKAA